MCRLSQRGQFGLAGLVALAVGLALLVLVSQVDSLGQPTASAGTVTIAISPASRTVTVDEIFTLDIRIEDGSQPVDTAAAFLDFNPVYLVVVDANGNPVSEITPGSALSTVLQNSVDNSAGHIDYVAGILTGTPPSGSFTLATIPFKAMAQTAGGGTPITFVFSPPTRNTDALYQGISVLGAHVNGNVTISAVPTATPTPTPTHTCTPTPTRTRTPTPSPTPTISWRFVYLPILLKNY